MKHANVPIFVPHLGCPHTCSFCDQRGISGTKLPPGPDQVKELLEAAAENLGERMRSAQIAFFGGSFTAVDPHYRRALLEAAQPFLDRGFAGIRVSTRPDCVDTAVLEELRGYRVTAVELGAQSMDDGVLARNNRGHCARDTRRAAELIRESGLSLGLQMMTGLPGDSDEGARETARQLAELRPDTLRVYPTLVLEGTGLAEWHRAGRYHPPSLEEAVALCAGLLAFFEERGIRVIRLGLHHTGELQGRVLAGPAHPAFRELCESRLLLQSALKQLEEMAEQRSTCVVELWVHPSSVSKMVGQRRSNLRRLREQGLRAVLRTDDSLGRLECRVRAAG